MESAFMLPSCLGDGEGRDIWPPVSSTTTPGLRGVQGGLLNMAAPHKPWGAFRDLMPDQRHR